MARGAGRRISAADVLSPPRLHEQLVPGLAGPYIPLGIGAVLLAATTRFLYGRSGPIPSLALVLACAAFFAYAALRFGAPRGALALLAVTVAIDRYTVNLGGLNMKAEHVAVVIGAAVVGYRLLRGEARLRLGPAEWLLLGWIGLNILAGAHNAPSPAGSVKLAVMLALVAGAYFVAIHLAGERSAFLFATAALLVAGSVVALYGVLAHLLYPFGLDLGIQINPITQAPAVYATIWEGNLFGSFCAILAVFWLALRLGASAARLRRAAEAGLLVALLAAEVSLARGAWLALLVGLGCAALLALVLARRDRRQTRPAYRHWAAYGAILVVASLVLWLNPLIYAAHYGDRLVRAVSMAVAPASSGAANSGLAVPVHAPPGGNSAAGTASAGVVVSRVQSSGNLGDPTYSQRRQDIARALRDWREHPLIGWGPGSYGQKYITTSYTPAWLPTISLRVLHDTGLLGAIIFHGFLILLGLRALLALWRTTDSALRAVLCGYVSGLVTLGVAYEVTEGFQLAFAWFLLGLTAAGTCVTLAANQGKRLAEISPAGPDRHGERARLPVDAPARG